MKPEFVDNRNENTLAEAIKNHLRWLRDTYAMPVGLSVATGYFNPEGFSLIANDLEYLSGVRLLLGAEPIPPPARPRRKPGEPSGDSYEAKLVRGALQAHSMGLSSDRDLLGFTPEVDAAVKRLISFLGRPGVEVRRYEKAFLHGKALIFASDEGVIAGSSNFTAGGLITNLELNLGRYDPTPVLRVKGWFDELWEEAELYDLASIYDARYQEYDPYLIYLRVLWERYRDELADELEADPRLRLTTFQNDGVWRAKRILEQYHGVLVADGVGLGKTFIGGEIIRQAVQDHKQRALLIAPAALRDGTWDRFANRYQLYFEKVSFEQLTADAQLSADNTSSHLRSRMDEYALVVIDEAQAFRNPDTERARGLRRLLQGTPPKNLVLVTATPVNNSLWDLYYLLSYFIKQDAAFADKGVTSLKAKFSQAHDEDPDALRPDMLFDVLDAVSVRRTRNFVKKYYPNDRIPGPDGQEIPIRFPRPHVRKVGDYELETALPGFLADFEAALMPEEGEPELTMARYSPSAYLRETPDEGREAALVGLLRSGLLKRLESSGYAFANTAGKMVEDHETFLQGLNRGYVLTAEGIAEWEETDNDEILERLTRRGDAESAAKYQLSKLQANVRKDMKLLRDFAERAASVHRGDDPKLKALVKELVTIVQQAEREGLDERDIKDRRKAIIFSYFADTVDWIEEYLVQEIQQNPQLAAYRGRVVSVVGQEARGGVSREAAIYGFAPESSEAPSGRDQDRYDVLITTDVLAEGQNLQQCRNVINYDLPWNPMRLVQRHGRVDRIGSPHDHVYIRCFFPDKELNRLLDLEARVRRKLAQAAASVGVETEVIPGTRTADVVFAQTRTEIEALRQEDPEIFENAGEDPDAHSGEEYRQELRKGLENRRQEIEGLPWAAGSGFVGGTKRGQFFCARVGERLFLRFIPADGSPIIRDTLSCLCLIACREDTPRYVAPDILARIYEGWQQAQRDIYDEWIYATDPANLQPRVRPLFRNVAEHLRRYPPRSVEQSDLDKAIEALEAPWGMRIENQLREVFRIEELDPYARSASLLDKVRELGLEPFQAPDPLPVIDIDEVKLICWMVVNA